MVSQACLEWAKFAAKYVLIATYINIAAIEKLKIRTHKKSPLEASARLAPTG